MKRILLFTATSGLLYLSLSSNSWGPASGGLNGTGGPGSTFDCSGCHAGGIGNTTASVEVRKLSSGPNGPIITQYIADTNYIVKLVGNNSALTHFGFQLMALDATNVDAGLFTSLPSNAQLEIAGGRNIVEHSTQIAKINNQYEATFHWKAPTTGTGTVTFYGIINGVNNNGAVGGDKPSAPFNVALTEATTNVARTEKNISITAFPNPITTKLNLRTNALEKGTYNLCVYDMSGKQVYNENISLTGATQETSINTVDWAGGIYHVQLSKGGMKQNIVVMKK